ncbi:hypothetical protein ACFPT7_05535 [Acidicapsa dinghuensis]|uniref:Uncharacterized protein n=1 Tax=Acidicapsa dinghuensis TaxID=2218256 RepID=A0ABW1EBQ0_9BACT|nr:hypothetical protein [Acidicapsa dinghuensis]
MLEEIQSSPSVVVSGNCQEVTKLLRLVPKQKTVAVTFPNDEQGAAAERVIRKLIEFLPQLIRKRQQETLSKLIDAFLSGVSPRRRSANRSAPASRPKQRR